MVCTFFGHRECYGLDEEVLLDTVKSLIKNGVDTFYVGNHGYFDNMVLSCLIKLQKAYPHISFSVVLAYLPTANNANYSSNVPSIYPEELETTPKRFAIDKRNTWMLGRASYCICYINHTWGGSYKFARSAKRRGLIVINLGRAEL